MRDVFGERLPHDTDVKIVCADPVGDEYQRDFVKRFYSARGRAELITRQLQVRFGPLRGEVRFQLAWSSPEELDAIGDRLLTAASLQEALASKS